MALAKREANAASQTAQTSQSRQPSARFPLVSVILGVLALVGIVLSLSLDFLYAPTDAVQGVAQRIFYIHLPSALIGMASFVIVAAAGVMYLVKRDERWDWVARAAAEIGLVFLSVALISGSLWGKPIWGTWWTWDPMLTSTLILWFIFVAYLMLRSYMGHTHEGARAGAVLAVIGVIDVPIIYEATNWWRTLHPPHQLGQSGALPPSVTLTVMVALTAFTLLYCFLMIQIYQLQRLQTLAQHLRASVE